MSLKITKRKAHPAHIGDRSGKITSAYYGISSTGECWFILRPDGLPYSLLPPYDNFVLVINFPEQTPKLQPGTYTKSDNGGIQMAEFTEGTEPQVHRFESAKAELSETGDYYTLTLSGTTSGDDIVSVTYTGPFFEADYETQSILGSGSYSIGNFSSSLRYAYVDIGRDESEKRTNLDLYIRSVPENVNGINRIYEFFFYLRFPGEESELQPGTYQETDDVIRRSRCLYYDEAGDYHSIDFKTLTLEISEEGTDYNGTDYKIKATGTLADEDESTVSVDFSGYVTYGYY